MALIFWHTSSKVRSAHCPVKMVTGLLICSSPLIEFDPDGAPLRALYTAMNEFDSLGPHLGIGEIQVVCAQFKPLLQLEKGIGELQIGIGKHRIIAFGMTGRNAGHGSGLRMEVAVAS